MSDDKPKQTATNGNTPKKTGRFETTLTPDELNAIMIDWLANTFQVKATMLSDFAKSNGELTLTFEVDRQ